LINIFPHRWADWGCNTLRDGDSYLFKPLCQKDKDSQEFPGPLDPTTTTTVAPPIITTSDPDFDSDKILPDLLQCIDTGVKYKTPKKDRINNVFQVETASKLSVRQILSCSFIEFLVFYKYIFYSPSGFCQFSCGILKTFKAR
jgi:hypothetical protein